MVVRLYRGWARSIQDNLKMARPSELLRCEALRSHNGWLVNALCARTRIRERERNETQRCCVGETSKIKVPGGKVELCLSDQTIGELSNTI